MAAGQRNQPTWQTDECPPWCARVHLETDHPEDRVHQSEPLTVPGVRRRSLLPEDQAERAEIDITMASQMTGRSPLWIRIGESEGRAFLMIDEPTTLRLVDGLRTRLRRSG